MDLTIEKNDLARQLAEQYDGDLDKAALAIAKAAGDADEALRIERSLAERNAIRPATGGSRGYSRGADSPSATEAPIITKWMTPDQAQRPARGADEAAVQKVWDECQIAAKLANARWNDPLRGARAYLEQVGQTKALDSYTATGASEWTNSLMSNDFLAAVAAKAKVANVIPQFTMPAKTVTLPGSSGRADCYRLTGNENATITADASVLSRSVSWVAEDLACRKDWSQNLEDDSIALVAAEVRDSLAYSVAYNIDRAILDGDTSTTHMDSAAVLSTDARAAWIGLRKWALTNTSANQDLSTFTVEALAAMVSGLGDYAENTEELCWIFPTKTYYADLMVLKDSNDNPVWVPAAGANAGPNPIVTGQIGTLFGIPVITSGIIRTDLSQSGYYQGDGYEVNNTVVHLFHRPSWRLGTRKQITIEVDKDITTQTLKCVATWRGDLQCTQPSDAVCSAIGFNKS